MPRLASLLIPAILALPSTSLAAQPKEDVAKTKARLDRGEVIVETQKVPGSQYPYVKAMAVVEAPPEAVWAILDDCANYKKTLPRISASAELKRTKNKRICKQTVSVPLVPDITTTTESTITIKPGKLWLRKFKLIKGDANKSNGSWTVAPFGKPTRTLAIYEIHVEPKMNIPPNLQKALMRQNLPSLFVTLRKSVATKLKGGKEASDAKAPAVPPAK